MPGSSNIFVTFKAPAEKFNVSEVKEYFINPNCFGDDLGDWILSKLSERNISVEEDGPDQEDFGWYVNFTIDGEEITCLIIYNESDRVWTLVFEYNAGLIGSIFGKRNKKVGSNVVELFSEILESDPKIKSIEWNKN